MRYQWIVGVGGVVLFLTIGGCQTAGRAAKSPTDNATVQAVLCPKCEIVWDDQLDLDDPYAVTYRPEKTMVCPDCQPALVTFFKTGRLQHACATCGEQRKHCVAHRDL